MLHFHGAEDYEYLAPLQAKQLPAQIDMCLAIDMLYVGLKLFCSPTKQHEVIAAGGIGDIFRRTVVNLDAPTVRYSPILQRVSGNTVFFSLIAIGDRPAFADHAPGSQRVPGIQGDRWCLR